MKVGDVIVTLASYCTDCTDEEPCEECLKMCNRYVISATQETLNGTTYFFGGHLAAIGGSCLMDTPVCYAATSDPNLVNEVRNIYSISIIRLEKECSCRS